MPDRMRFGSRINTNSQVFIGSLRVLLIFIAGGNKADPIAKVEFRLFRKTLTFK